MKNYKFLVPIILVVLFFGSIYMLYDTKNTEQQEYNINLASAREFREKDIQVDAEVAYMQALGAKPSLELYLEIGDFYKQTNQTNKAMDWGVAMTQEYPTEVQSYEFLIEIYDNNEDYIACYGVADTVRKRQLQSKMIDEIMDRMEYAFYYSEAFQNAGIYSGGLCPVQYEGKWGYVDELGSRVTPMTFSYAGPFAAGIAPVTDQEGDSYFIDTQGNKKHIVQDVESIEQLGLLEDGMFSLYDGQKWYFYNTNHEMIFGGFEDASAIGNGMAAVKTNGKWKVVDRSGTDLTGKTFDAVVMDGKQIVHRNERLFVVDGGVYQMITPAGDVVGKDNYSDARLFNDTTYAAVKIGSEWGFIDKNGEVMIQPQYEEARSFANGMAAVKVDGLWGFIDKNGELVIDPQFEDARDFNSKGCVFVFRGGEWVLLCLYKYNH